MRGECVEGGEPGPSPGPGNVSELLESVRLPFLSWPSPWPDDRVIRIDWDDEGRSGAFTSLPLLLLAPDSEIWNNLEEFGFDFERFVSVLSVRVRSNGALLSRLLPFASVGSFEGSSKDPNSAARYD